MYAWFEFKRVKEKARIENWTNVHTTESYSRYIATYYQLFFRFILFADESIFLSSYCRAEYSKESSWHLYEWKWKQIFIIFAGIRFVGILFTFDFDFWKKIRYVENAGFIVFMNEIENEWDEKMRYEEQIICFCSFSKGKNSHLIDEWVRGNFKRL